MGNIDDQQRNPNMNKKMQAWFNRQYSSYTEFSLFRPPTSFAAQILFGENYWSVLGNICS